jgi:O-antigen ligase
LATCCLVNLRQGQGLAVGLERIWPETIGFFLVLVWGLFQLSSFSPEIWHHPLWKEAGRALGTDLQGSISLVRGDGFASLMRLLTYGAVFFLSLQLGRDRHWAGILFWTLTLAGTAYAVYGLVLHFGRVDMVLWEQRIGAFRNVSGPFINRNNFATYLGLSLLCASGLYLTGLFKVLYSHRVGRDRTLHLLQEAFVKGAPLFSCILILMTALFLTGSRAGVTASLVALIVLMVFLGMLTRTAGWGRKLLIVSLLTAALGVFFLSGEGWLDRLMGTDLEKEGRLLVYEQTMDAISRSPWTGYGIGSYEQTFFLFADERTVTSIRAHNDWLEMTFELGIPMALVWFCVLISLGLRCLAGFFRRHRDFAYPLAGFCACLLVGLHSLVDFSLQIPAVAVTFATILGVGLAQGWSSEEEL